MKYATASILLWGLLGSAANLCAEPTATAEVAKAEFILPRFSAVPFDFEHHPGLEEALQSVPSVKAEDSLFSWSFTATGKTQVKGFMTRLTFDPDEADVGDIAKAVAALPVPEEEQQKPAAILLVFTASREKLSDEQRERVWKALEHLKGINVEESRKLLALTVFGIVLDDKGGAKLREITAAVKSTGLELQAR